MAEVLCVYREVQVLKEAAAKAEKSNKPVAIVSCDEKPGIRPSPRRHRICPPVPGRHASFARIMSTNAMALSLLAGIDLLTGKVRARRKLPQPRVHRIPQASRCRLSGQHRDQADPRQSFRTHFEETRAWLDTRPPGRRLTFTPKHGSWLNLIEGFLQVRSRGPAPHPGDLKARTQGAHAWPASTTSIAIPSSTLGPTSLPRPPDMIRTTETLTSFSAAILVPATRLVIFWNATSSGIVWSTVVGLHIDAEWREATIIGGTKALFVNVFGRSN